MSQLNIIGTASPIFFQGEEGVTDYGDNSGMHDNKGKKPDLQILQTEQQQVQDTLQQLGVRYAIKPPSLLSMMAGADDDVFTKDVGISLYANGAPQFVLSRFAPHVEGSRGIEVQAMVDYIQSLISTAAQKIIIPCVQVPEGTSFEGGEQNTVTHDKVSTVIYGTGRASMEAQQWVLQNHDVGDVLHIASDEHDAYHVDTVTGIVVGTKNTALLLCKDVVNAASHAAAQKFCRKKGWQLIDISETDSIGVPGHDGERTSGNYACNGVSFAPGSFVSGHEITTPGVTDELKYSVGAEHIVTPTTQLAMSGGSVNCNRFMLNGIAVDSLQIDKANIAFIISQAEKAVSWLRELIGTAQREHIVNNAVVKQLQLLTPAVVSTYFVEYGISNHQLKDQFLSLREQYLELSQDAL